MQQIERYGVIALVFLLVTIVAVSFWGDSKSPGFWSRLTGKSDGKKEQTDTVVASDAFVTNHVSDANLPLSGGTTPTTLPPADGSMLPTGNMNSLADAPVSGNATIPGLQPAGPGYATPGAQTPANPFLPQGNVGQIAPPPIAPSNNVGSEYIVQKGDSLALIAKRKLGAESRWTEIQSANPGLDPKHLALGMKLTLPAPGPLAVTNPAPRPAVVAAKQNPSATPKPSAKSKKPESSSAAKTASRSYTVKKGDLLRSIARAQLGDEKRWQEIVALNPGIEPSKLAVGQKLRLPASAEARPSVSAPTVAASAKPRVK